MLALLRILFGFALFSVFSKAVQTAGPLPVPETEGTTDAGFVALAVGIGILNAIVWAPFIGHLLADPLTGAFTTGHPADFRNTLVQFVNKLAARRWRRTALFFAFFEGIRHPDLPAAFVLGLRESRPGSWLEKVFAREVWRFDNAENCLRAWRILSQRGVALGVHRRPEVNLLILSVQREKSPTPQALNLVAAPPPPPPPRNEKIQLFSGAPGPMPEAAAPPPPDPSSLPTPPSPPPPTTAEPLSREEAAPEATGSRLSTSNPEAQAEGPPGERRLTFLDRLKILFTGKL